jgi:hypothetical protein
MNSDGMCDDDDDCEADLPFVCVFASIFFPFCVQASFRVFRRP